MCLWLKIIKMILKLCQTIVKPFKSDLLQEFSATYFWSAATYLRPAATYMINQMKRQISAQLELELSWAWQFLIILEIGNCVWLGRSAWPPCIQACSQWKKEFLQLFENNEFEMELGWVTQKSIDKRRKTNHCS